MSAFLALILASAASEASSVDTKDVHMQSTYDRVKAKMQEQQGPTMADVYQTYLNTGKPGGMTNNEAWMYEQAVIDGRLMLPRGAEIRRKLLAPEIPVGVVLAYNSGKMEPNERELIDTELAAGRIALPRGMELQTPPPQTFADQSISLIWAFAMAAGTLVSGFLFGRASRRKGSFS